MGYGDDSVVLLILESAATNSAGDTTPSASQSIAVTRSFIRMGVLFAVTILRHFYV